VADPTLAISRIPTLPAAEARRQLVEWNATSTHRPSRLVHQLVEAQRDRNPAAPALSVDGSVVSYSELNRRSEWEAARLHGVGVGPGDVVALCSPPSIDLVIGLLGVVKAGAGYLLLDPESPPEQRNFMAADSGAAALLAPAGLAAGPTVPPGRVLALGHADHGGRFVPAPAGAPDPGALCCVQYTSKTPGRPTGVPIRHGAVVNLAAAMAADLGIGPADTVLVLPQTLFHASLVELWVPLMAGAKVVIAPTGTATDGARLSRLITAQRVNFLHAPPSTWQTLIGTGLKATRGLRALSGGECLSPALADQILDRCRVLWNAYGATETTGYSLLARVERSVPIAIGRPIANTRAYVLDGNGQPTPVGVTGELLLAGDGVASGYLGRPGLTAQAFVDEPVGRGRAYRTGDLARWLPEGRMELVRSATPSSATWVEPRRTVTEEVAGCRRPRSQLPGNGEGSPTGRDQRPRPE
jgi:amino acid adenylation domain-containing protein